MALDSHSCRFCKEIRELGSPGTDLALVLPDAHPVSAGHCLVVSRRHAERVEQLAPAEWNAVFSVVRNVALELEVLDDVDGLTIGVNSGLAADQTVAHAHVHLIPRRFGDCENPRGGVRWALSP